MDICYVEEKSQNTGGGAWNRGDTIIRNFSVVHWHETDLRKIMLNLLQGLDKVIVLWDTAS
ncbi:hypothetical protein EXIGLDRAFT_725865 [Exidia glandulosa HHB12029]|uniref:Uncharacterized protein n=1 Tax=Exidia glandulosa HHB12029 TaxID=1314781 RepID=A0A165MGK5_EXIGL|nr:hypothetical protein EXIGLDRAFT_725863 [Exidia glandulosa HHB12029]KZV99234.1 hypothetical protein EXIGLDRAFT_725865 [Exidia glandulosa HHB12029]